MELIVTNLLIPCENRLEFSESCNSNLLFNVSTPCTNSLIFEELCIGYLEISNSSICETNILPNIICVAPQLTLTFECESYSGKLYFMTSDIEYFITSDLEYFETPEDIPN